MALELEAPPLAEADLTLLLEALGEDALACEARHDLNGGDCSIEVTHRERLTCRSEVRNVCTAEALMFADCVRVGVHQCNHCQRPLAECWTIIPI